MNQLSNKDVSRIQENMIANFLNWNVIKGSGNRPCHPGDIISDDWLGECKTHKKSGHTLNFSVKVWKKIVEEATQEHRQPILFVDDGSQRLKNTWAMVYTFAVNTDIIKVENYIKSYSTDARIKLVDLDVLFYSNTYCPNVAFRFNLCNYDVAIMKLESFNDMIHS